MEKTVEAERAIKQAVTAEAIKFTDESYRTMFLKEHPVYVVETDKEGKPKLDENGKPISRLLSNDEKTQFQAGPDGKVNIATNGIYNTPEEAINNAVQNAKGKTGPIYVVYFPRAENAVSELLVAGYQYFLENDLTGLTNSTAQIKGAMQEYGQSGLDLYGHSRGGMTIGNALESQARTDDAAGSLSNTSINFFAPAYNAQKAANLLDDASGGAVTSVTLQNHGSDFVGSLLGMNPSGGYDKVPDDSSSAWERFNIIWGAYRGEKTVHTCGGAGGEGCTNKYGAPVTQTIYSDRVQPKK
jgi:filamentous hemagglutinin